MSYAIVDGILVWVGEGSPAVITRNSDSYITEPLLIVGYETTRSQRNLTHDMLDGSIVVTLLTPRPRSGTLRLLYADEYAAQGCMDLHATPDTFTLVTGDRYTLNMVYTAGTLSMALDDQTSDHWIVSVEYQEL
jgi:hypothetical protein